MMCRHHAKNIAGRKRECLYRDQLRRIQVELDIYLDVHVLHDKQGYVTIYPTGMDKEGIRGMCQARWNGRVSDKALDRLVMDTDARRKREGNMKKMEESRV